jgi:hypothetical protein
MKLDLHGMKGHLWTKRSVKDDEPTVWNTLIAAANGLTVERPLLSLRSRWRK